MKRNAIILDKNLTIGEVGNVSAILMGQVSKEDSSIFSDNPVIDLDNVQHAGIKFSTVVLKGGSGQIVNLAKQLANDKSVISIVFTALGQSLNNKFEDYAASLSNSSLETAEPVGIVLSGEDTEIRKLTKKFSLLH